MSKPILHRSILACALALLAGCVGPDGKHTYYAGRCITCMNNPITGEPLNYERPDGKDIQFEQYAAAGEPKPRAKRENPWREGTIGFRSPVDVNTAYTRLKRAFGYQTRSERLKVSPGMRGRGGHSWLDDWDGFHHEMLPGVRYHMRDLAEHVYGGVNYENRLDLQIEKDGPGSRILFTFWTDQTGIDLDDYGASLMKRAKEALEGI